jgi:hypothetical protein
MVRSALVIGLVLFSVAAVPQQQAPPVNAFAQEMADFKKRVDAYMKLRDEATRKLPDVKETGDPAKISARETALGQAIANARSSAQPGDIFGPEMSAYLKKILAADWKTRSAADRKALFEEIPRGLQLKINQPYPTTLPLVSAPAKLLAQLPMLPEALEYRLVDRYFLLRDRDANLIVDVLAGVYPTRDR